MKLMVIICFDPERSNTGRPDNGRTRALRDLPTPVPPPLSGVRILDFSRVLAGPFATALLADIGADIIKVEPPDGDDYRHIGPFIGGDSALFMATNRGKRSIVLDLKRAHDLAIARELASDADIVVENFRPGVADKLGIGYAELAPTNPRLIYLSISGFGQFGPMRDRPAYDMIVQAESGLMSVTGEADGPPMPVGEAMGDLISGLFGAWSLSSALYARERTGRGTRIDLAMFDALLSMLPTAVCRYRGTGVAPQRVGNRHPLSAPFGVYRTNNGYIVIAVLNERLFERFAGVIGRLDLVGDPRFASDPARCAHEAALRTIIEDWSFARPSDEVVAILAAAGIPAARIADIAEAVTSDQVAARQLFRGNGPMPLAEQPAHFSGVMRGRPTIVPTLDGDRDDILASLALGSGWRRYP